MAFVSFFLKKIAMPLPMENPNHSETLSRTFVVMYCYLCTFKNWLPGPNLLLHTSGNEAKLILIVNVL